MSKQTELAAESSRADEIIRLENEVVAAEQTITQILNDSKETVLNHMIGQWKTDTLAAAQVKKAKAQERLNALKN